MLDTQIFWGFFSTASPEWLRTCLEGMSGDSRHLADPPVLPWLPVMDLGSKIGFKFRLADVTEQGERTK